MRLAWLSSFMAGSARTTVQPSGSRKSLMICRTSSLRSRTTTVLENVHVPMKWRLLLFLSQLTRAAKRNSNGKVAKRSLSQHPHPPAHAREDVQGAIQLFTGMRSGHNGAD